MANTNCLEGMKCPECCWDESFMIAATTMAEVTDQGVEDYEGMEWDNDSYAECPNCDWSGKVKELRTGGMT